ncbi:MAG: sugar phosphate isomerase/epimerase [Victivallales bacterium]|jgi:sugar phosphate isomerase/epimerase
MRRKHIAAQLYTLRDFLKTPEDIATSLKKVKKIGFDAVQISGLGPIDTAELRKMLDGEGLTCCATHESGQMIFDQPEKVVEKLNLLGCKYTAYPWPHTSPKTEEDYKQLAAALNKSGKVLRDAGQVLTYHNHGIEFERFGKKTGLEIIYDETSPEYLQGEIDTYWVQFGGGNPVEWCRRLENRLPLLHLKEYGIIESQPKMLEVGSGNLDWGKIVRAARKSGTEWFIVEQDVCRIDPFDSLKMSLEYLIKEI